MEIPSVPILGVPIAAVSMNEALFQVDQMLIRAGQHLVVTANPEMLVLAHRDAHYKSILLKASLVVPDGIGMLWAAKFTSVPSRHPFLFALKTLISVILFPSYLRHPIPERVSGVDLVTALASRHAGSPVRWYLLGAAPGVAETVQTILEKRYRGLTIVSADAGAPDDPETLRRIVTAAPTLLLVAYGHGKQERWIHQNLSHLPSVKVAIGVGGTFDFISGKAHRAPEWMRKIGMEWLWRLIQEPRRILRIWTATVVFPRLVYKNINKQHI